MRESPNYYNQLEEVKERCELLYPGRFSFNKKETAQIIGVSRTTIQEKKWKDLFINGISTTSRIARFLSREM